MALERVTSSIIHLRPPEKLVIEVRATGRYDSIVWELNEDPNFPVSDTDNFAHFSEIFVVNQVTFDNFGRYEVKLPIGAVGQQEPSQLRFDVIVAGKQNICVRQF